MAAVGRNAVLPATQLLTQKIPMYISAYDGLGECFTIPERAAPKANAPEQIQFVEVRDVKHGFVGGRLTTSFSKVEPMSSEKKQAFIKRFIDPMLKHDLAAKVLVALNRGPHPVGIACGNGRFGFNGTIALDRAQAVGGRGSPAIIFIDEKASDWSKLETILGHPDVGLFHELLHALQIQSGVATNDENESERRVIGIEKYSKCGVTENAYRNARELLPRCCRDREQL